MERAEGAALVKQEPEWTTSYCHMTTKEEVRFIDEVCVKEVPEYASGAACANGTGAGLCAGAARVVKDELDLGPARVQHRPDIRGLSRPLLSSREAWPERGGVTHREPAGTTGAEHDTAQQNKNTDSPQYTGETYTYKCYTCDQIFLQKHCLIGHLLEASETSPNESLFIFEPSETGVKKYSCKICKKKYEGKYLKIHERFHTGEKPYTCEVCKKQFAVLGSLREHKRTHTGEKPYSCDVCAKSYARSRYLKIHKLSHTRKKPHSYEICKKRDGLTSSLKSHIRTHTEEKPYGCTICKKWFTHLSVLEAHKLTHDKPYSCEICKMTFMQLGDLHVHEIIHKDKPVLEPGHTLLPNTVNALGENLRSVVSVYTAHDKPVKAHDEPAGTTAESETVHQNTFTDTMHHTAEAHTYKCNTCGEIFLQKQFLIDHIKVHFLETSETLPNESLFIFDPSDTSVKKYTCRICTKKFRKDYLKIHERFHTGEKPYTCEVCKKQFAVLGSLREHKRMHTGERPYSCNVCAKRFARLNTLKKHERSHSGEKPYKCETCQKGFTLLSNLRSHIRTHTGETPYSCTMCHKQFTQWSALNNHKRSHTADDISKNKVKQGASNFHKVTHTIEKPFSCETCKKTFRKKSNFENHKRKHELVNLKEKYECESSTDPCGTSETHKETRVKEEPKCESNADSCRMRETAAGVDFVIKDELELGPEGVQRRDIAVTSRGLSRPLFSNGEAWPERGGVTHRQPAGLTHSEPAGTTGAEHDTAQQNKNTDSPQYTGETYTYKCYTCGQIFLQKHCLIDHVKVHLLEASETSPKESLFILEPSETGVKKYSCKICKKKYEGKNLKIHKRFHTGEKPYACEVCTMQFAALNSLRQHKRTHTGERPYSCDVCTKSYARSRYLKIHKLSHTREKPHSCEICKKRFGLTSSLKTHMRTHMGEEPYSCAICKKRFTQWSVLEAHKLTHDKPYSCEICKMTFMQLGALQVHELIHKDKLVLEPGHTLRSNTVNALGKNSLSVASVYGPALDRCAVTPHDGPAKTTAEHETVQQNTFTDTMHHTAEAHTYKCNTCGEIFLQKQFLIDHIKVHFLEASETLPNESLFIFDPSDTSINKYTCRICAKKFRKDYLKIHERVHTGEKPYTCEVCKKQFAFLGSLREHKRIHTGERPYSCNLCTKSFAGLNNLKAHESTHTGEKPHKCETCLKGFTLLSNLRSHIRTHTGETPYSCTMCDKQFTQWSALNNHKRSHTGEKTYPCDISKNKVKQGASNVHKVIHTIEKPFSCETCKKTFRKKSSFENHKRKHELVNLKEKYECESSTDPCGTSETHKETRVKEEPKCESNADSCRMRETAAGVDFVIKDELELGPEGVQRRDITVTSRAASPRGELLATTSGASGAQQPATPQKTNTTHDTLQATIAGTHVIKRNRSTINKQTTSKRLYTCNICEKAFTQSGSLNTHKRIHTGEKPYSCKVCNKKFTALSTLNNHIIALHTYIKPYSCEICNKRFKGLASLKSHGRIHTTGKPYSCDICKKQFRHKNTLQSHNLIHAGVKPYSCDICKQQFRVKSGVEAHIIKMHIGGLPFSCGICKKQFCQKSALKVHNRIHTGAKPYACEICKQPFSRKDVMEKHIFHKHAKDMYVKDSSPPRKTYSTVSSINS